MSKYYGVAFWCYRENVTIDKFSKKWLSYSQNVIRDGVYLYLYYILFIIFFI